MEIERVRDLLALSHVPRWTTHPVARAQSVAEHSYRVTVIASYIATRCEATMEQKLLIIQWAMSHDGPESKTGDVPSPLKVHIRKELGALERLICPWYDRIIALLDDHESSQFIYSIVRMADTIEAYSWLKRYGHGFKDRFDSENIEHKLSRRIWSESESSKTVGFRDAVTEIMSEVG